ncbi:MAG TPA: membrane protein insertase YidC [Xanthomonadales bacterium]|nr:membrane protein insertase YidC [Xanthomonadales bacterium]
MGNLRSVLLISLGLLGYMLWLEWQKDYPAAPVAPPAETASSSLGTGSQSPQSTAADQDLPRAPQPAPSEARTSQPSEGLAGMQAENPTVSVTTDVLELEISLQGGTVVSALLLNYAVEQKEPAKKVNLLDPTGDQLFIAQSGLLSNEAAPNHTAVYTSSQAEYRLADGADEVRVPLTWRSNEGIEVTKTFVLKRGRYDIIVRHQLENGSDSVWTGSRYDQLQQAVTPDKEEKGFTNPGSYSFRGIAFYSPEDKFEKIQFDAVAEEPYDKTFSGGWLAMIQHYFFAAWIPAADEQATYTTQAIQSNGWPRYIARDVSPLQSANPGGRTEFTSRLYLGPKLQDDLEQIAPGLEHTVNYGIFTVFSKPLFWLLAHIHTLVGNWGWAIVLLTVLVKAAFFKLTEAQYKSMARMRKLQPRIEQLKERYGDDRQRMSQAMMELYKTEKANPLAGCLPMVVQIPVFIALYWVLLESVELRQAPFILWVTNLSARDPYFVLPLLNAGFMIATQRLTPMAGMDPLQRKMMSMMPVVFSVMFAFFPAGLVLYWATNAGLSLAQQVYITRKIAAREK